MSRSVPEWVGSTPDAKVPPRVRIRIFEREGGICHISGRKITPSDLWDLDHGIALINGGEHREGNLFPALRDKHREKTVEDVAIKAKGAAIRARHLGIKPPSRWASRPMGTGQRQHTATSPVTKRVGQFGGDNA